MLQFPKKIRTQKIGKAVFLTVGCSIEIQPKIQRFLILLLDKDRLKKCVVGGFGSFTLDGLDF